MGLFSTCKTEKSEDNIETLSPEIVTVLKNFVESVELPFSDAYCDETEDIEWQSRSGFIAYNSTRGGFDRIAVIPTHYLTASGELYGLACQDRVEEFEKDSFEQIKKDNPEMNDEQIEDTMRDEASEYDDIAYRVRILYKGDNQLQIDSGFDYDAPYFRWSNKSDFEADIKFKNVTDLKTKLSKIAKKIESAQYKKRTKTKKVA
jgi:hypothetical protein